ncbi:MAG: cytochrome c-type biogenesis protein CcmH [Nannocystis sp.]|nr:cytochrome c-type biogenesis protein CcmH [Nannocystis sp.]MBA3545361.1 cytochrome c-type biogenesis protein CcmH [Nannocystis sp.]
MDPKSGLGPEQAAEATELATQLSHDLMSPYCPGRTIATCPSPQARKLESNILNQALAGKTRVEIEAQLAERFPDIRGYLGRPEIIYGTALVALLAIIGLFLAARRWVGHGRAAVSKAASAAAAADMAADVAGDTGPPRAGSASPSVPAAGRPSRREIDALDDALDRIDEF